MSAPLRSPETADGTRFGTAQEAWFWTLGALRARREGGSRRSGPRTRRPCDPDDVIRCLDGLWRAGRLDPAHLRVMRLCGERGHAPEAHRPGEHRAAYLWEEAMERLAAPLRAKGIVESRPDEANLGIFSLTRMSGRV